MRTGLLAQSLVNAGHEVTWWASTFNHFTKSHRAHEDRLDQWSSRYKLYLMHSPGYSSNVSLRRLLDHRLLGRKFAKLAQTELRPDVIHCGFPTIELAFHSSRYARANGVPLVLDTRDMWPDIFVEALPGFTQGLARLALTHDFSMARSAFRSASAITAHAPGFVEWGLQLAQRAGTDLDRDFPFAYPDTVSDPEALQTARQYWRSVGVGSDPDELVVCFFGTFAARREVDLETVVAAARQLQARSAKVRIILCGSGPASDRIQSGARGLHNVHLPGWVDFPRIWTLMRLSHLGLLPYLPSRDFLMSIPNKAVEYVSGGLPVVTSLDRGFLAKLFAEYGCVKTYRAGADGELAETLESLQQDRSKLSAMQNGARTLFDHRFRLETVNSAMMEHLEDVVQRYASGHSRSGSHS